jgi:hypothetical protein
VNLYGPRYLGRVLLTLTFLALINRSAQSLTRAPFNPNLKLSKSPHLIILCRPYFSIPVALYHFGLRNQGLKITMSSVVIPSPYLFQGPLTWTIVVKDKIVHLDEEIIELIRADLLHIWGWYQAEMAQAWTNVAPRAISSASLDHPSLDDLAWLQESSPFWNFHSDLPRIAGVNSVLRKFYKPSLELRLSQFLEEVLSATFPDWFTERKILLSIPINLGWLGNITSVALAQTTKCVPEFSMIVTSSKMRGTS